MFSFFPSRVLPLKVDTESGHEYVHQNGIPTSPPSCEIIEIKGDQFADKAEAEHLDLSSLDLYALAVATAVGGHYLPWNEGLQGGFGTFIIAVAFIASGYFCLVLSLSELSSALPFAGGSYGLARVTLGIFPGYLVAYVDSYKSVMYVSSAAYAVGELVTEISGCHEQLEPLWWALFYLGSLMVHTQGGRLFWCFNKVFAVITVSILLIYIFGTIKFADFNANAPLAHQSGTEAWMHHDFLGFMHILPKPAWFFLGIQSINLSCGKMKNPKLDVPRGYFGAIATTCLTSIGVVFLSCSLAPGVFEFKEQFRPLTQGFQHMFALSRPYATIFSLPATVSSGFGFMFYFGLQLMSMGQSGLIHPALGYESPQHKSPVVALVFGSAVGYALCVLSLWVPSARKQVYNISMLGAFATYFSELASFIAFRMYYPTIQREFVSPLGIPGAVYGCGVFLLAFASVAGFQKTPEAIVSFAVLTILASVYYYLVVQKRQVFSEEEKTVMFKAYLVKNNSAARARRNKKSSPYSALSPVVSHSHLTGANSTSTLHASAHRPSLSSVVPAAEEAHGDVEAAALPHQQQGPTEQTRSRDGRCGGFLSSFLGHPRSHDEASEEASVVGAVRSFGDSRSVCCSVCDAPIATAGETVITCSAGVSNVGCRSTEESSVESAAALHLEASAQQEEEVSLHCSEGIHESGFVFTV